MHTIEADLNVRFLNTNFSFSVLLLQSISSISEAGVEPVVMESSEAESLQTEGQAEAEAVAMQAEFQAEAGAVAMPSDFQAEAAAAALPSDFQGEAMAVAMQAESQAEAGVVPMEHDASSMAEGETAQEQLPTAEVKSFAFWLYNFQLLLQIKTNAYYF